MKLTLAYDGSAFAGWQVQPGRRTVQGVLEEAIERVTGERVRAAASGRTDAGVHALAQVAAFRTASRLPPETLVRAINAYLPADAAVLAAADAAADFHPVRDAVSKRYRYVLLDAPVRDVFLRRYAWHVRRPLDEPAMAAAARPLLGRHDFASFQASGSPRASTVRRVLDIGVRRGQGGDPRLVVVEIEADGFLYNMARNMVGALAEVGLGKQPPEWIGEVLAARDRAAAAVTAPAHGLYLVSVRYDRCGSPTSSPE